LLLEIRAIVPSSKSLRAKMVIKSVPINSSPEARKEKDAATTPTAPIVVNIFAVKPSLKSSSQTGVISRVTGARNRF
jgi:hypothetical protein